MLDRELIELMKQKGSREPHSRGFVCFAAGTARCLSVCLLPCFSNHLESFRASAISPNKATGLFSLSHQQLSLSRIRSIGPKLLCYRHLTEAKQEKQCSCCLFYVTPTAPDCRTVSAAYGYVLSENIPLPMLFLICRVSPFCSELLSVRDTCGYVCLFFFFFKRTRIFLVVPKKCKKQMCISSQMAFQLTL